MKIGTRKMSLAALLALSLIASTALPQTAMAAPPHHDDHGRHDDWRRHEGDARRWRAHPGPGPVVYAPPAVVYTPEPPPPGGLNLFIPLNIR